MTLVDQVQAVKVENAKLREDLKGVQKDVDRFEEQINGERGISAAIRDQTAEIRGLRKAAYWLAALIVTSSVGFAFSVLTLIP